MSGDAQDGYYARFKESLKPYLDYLDHFLEEKRLIALAKIEEAGYDPGIPRQFLLNIIDMARTDPSSVIRAYELRMLYHPSSEQWPVNPREKDNIWNAIRNGRALLYGDEKRNDPFGRYQILDDLVRYDLMEIEESMGWITRKQDRPLGDQHR